MSRRNSVAPFNDPSGNVVLSDEAFKWNISSIYFAQVSAVESVPNFINKESYGVW